jgi:hypothetical protein
MEVFPQRRLNGDAKPLVLKGVVEPGEQELLEGLGEGA